MFKLKGIKVGAALLLLGGIANAAVVIDSQQIPSGDIVSITISPTSGDMFITTVDTVDYEVTSTPVDGGPIDPQPDAVAVTSFSASSSTFVEGGSTTLSWQTENAASCAPSGGTPDWTSTIVSSASGSKNISIAAPGSYNFRLTCTGSAGDTATRSLTIQVTEEAVVLAGDCPASPLSGSNSTWADFWKAEFPQPGYSLTNMSVPRSGYVALKFNTGNITDAGSVLSVGNTITSGNRTLAISECPGDFVVPKVCTARFGTGGSLIWSTGPMAGACELNPQTDYYLNITFTDGVNSGSSTCTTSNCIATLQAYNSNR